MNERSQVNAIELPSPVPSRLRGVGYWFSEDSSFAFGLQVDMRVFTADLFDAPALYDRFYSRIIGEYDRLAALVATHRASDGIDAYPANPEEDIPLSITVLVEEVLFLQIVPAAIGHQELRAQLPEKLRCFIEMLGDAVGHMSPR